jgi:phosphoglycolate phosphatase-like HAD superfamily hydrolase
MTRLAVFDCDGTLVDSQVNICRAMEACFVAHRLEPPTREDIRRIVGLSLVPAIAQLLPLLAAAASPSKAVSTAAAAEVGWKRNTATATTKHQRIDAYKTSSENTSCGFISVQEG